MNRSIGLFVLQISVALYLFATGIIGLFGKSWLGGGEIRQAVLALFRGTFADILIIIFAIIAIAGGILLLLELFGMEFEITELLLTILMIVWVVFIILVDIYYPIRYWGGNFIYYLRGLASHVMVLGGMACASKRFGGN